MSFYAPGSVMGETVDLVIEKMKYFKGIADTFENKMSGVLGDMANVKMSAVPSPDPITVPDLSFTDLSVPQNNLQTPDLSVLDGVQFDDNFPNAPNATMPVMGEHTPPKKPNINTDIELPNLERYKADLDKIKDTYFSWQEPKYQCELFDTLHGKIKGIVSGNDTATGLPIQIEQALFDRANDRESREVLRLKQDAIDTWAARGFELPSGVLNKQLNAINEQASLKSAELNRDILVQSAQWKIETLRFAIERGIALEELCFNIWNNGVNRLFESVRFAFTAEIEKQKAILTIIETLLKTSQIKADIIKTQFDAYKTEVSAFAETISAEKVKFDAYSAQMNAYNTLVNAHATRLKSKADIASTVANAKINKYKADIDGYRAELQVAVSQAELKTTYAKLLSDTTMNFERLKIEEYKAKLSQAAHEAQLALEAMKALGGYAAQLAAGAMSAQHISASMSAHGSASDSTSTSTSTSTSHNYTY
ncbi:MAG: hypothetical protein IKI11_07080 [Neisseriaceae bacterium]|nr:hypothetical protein [Neisseriaceae bacterium]